MAEQAVRTHLGLLSADLAHLDWLTTTEQLAFVEGQTCHQSLVGRAGSSRVSGDLGGGVLGRLNRGSPSVGSAGRHVCDGVRFLLFDGGLLGISGADLGGTSLLLGGSLSLRLVISSFFGGSIATGTTNLGFRASLLLGRIRIRLRLSFSSLFSGLSSIIAGGGTFDLGSNPVGCHCSLDRLRHGRLGIIPICLDLIKLRIRSHKVNGVGHGEDGKENSESHD